MDNIRLSKLNDYHAKLILRKYEKQIEQAKTIKNSKFLKVCMIKYQSLS